MNGERKQQEEEEEGKGKEIDFYKGRLQIHLGITACEHFYMISISFMGAIRTARTCFRVSAFLLVILHV